MNSHPALAPLYSSSYTTDFNAVIINNENEFNRKVHMYNTLHSWEAGPSRYFNIIEGLI